MPRSAKLPNRLSAGTSTSKWLGLGGEKVLSQEQGQRLTGLIEVCMGPGELKSRGFRVRSVLPRLPRVSELHMQVLGRRGLLGREQRPPLPWGVSLQGRSSLTPSGKPPSLYSAGVLAEGPSWSPSAPCHPGLRPWVGITWSGISLLSFGPPTGIGNGGKWAQGVSPRGL